MAYIMVLHVYLSGHSYVAAYLSRHPIPTFCAFSSIHWILSKGSRGEKRPALYQAAEFEKLISNDVSESEQQLALHHAKLEIILTYQNLIFGQTKIATLSDRQVSRTVCR